jgi:hypothetical protein
LFLLFKKSPAGVNLIILELNKPDSVIKLMYLYFICK